MSLDAVMSGRGGFFAYEDEQQGQEENDEESVLGRCRDLSGNRYFNIIPGL